MYFGFRTGVGLVEARRSRDAKVEQPDAGRRQHEVVGLHVAMDDAVLVHVRQRVGDVAREEQGVTNGDVDPCA